MIDTSELKKYLKKLQRTVDGAEFSFFGSSIAKKNKIDDVLVCIIALLPESYKRTMKKRVAIDKYPSVSSFNRLSKVIKKPFFLSKDFYIFNTGEVLTLIQNISKNIERDINRFEEEEEDGTQI